VFCSQPPSSSDASMSFAATGQLRDASTDLADRDLERDGESIGIICVSPTEWF
jgi:hypothetical protein